MKNKTLYNRPVCVLLIFAIVFGVYGVLLLAKGDELSVYTNYKDGYEYVSSEICYGEKGERAESEIIEVKGIKVYDGYVKAVIKAKTKGTEDIRFNVHSVGSNGTDKEMRSVHEKIKVIPFNIITQNLYQHIYIVLSVLSFLIILYYIFCFANAVKTRRYSYDTIFFLSVVLFLALLNIVWVVASIYSFKEYHTTSSDFIYSFNQNLMTFLTISTLPIMAIFVVSVSVSNIALMKKEGFRPVGIITSIAMLGGLGALLAAYIYNQSYPSMTVKIVYAVLSSLYLFFVIILASAIIYGIYVSRHVPEYDKDYIIILGCKIKDDGTLYPLIRGRVDRAIEFYKKQLEKTGKAAYFVPSGGQGSDEIIAEGEAMKRYLVEQGIPEDGILAETESTTTRENMLFSKKIIDGNSDNAKIVFSTTSYHVFRSGAIAYDNGINIEGIGSKTKWYFWPNAFLREVAGIFTTQPKKQIIITVLIALSAGLGSFIYSLF